VKGDDPKIEKQEGAEPYGIRDRRCLNLSGSSRFEHLRVSSCSGTAEGDY